MKHSMIIRVVNSYILLPSMLEWIDRGLTLSGTGQGTFTLMSLIDQILSADFFFKNFQMCLDVKIEINWVILTSCPAHYAL